MRHQVEDRRRPSADAERHEHVADLAHGGVGEDALEVALRQRGERGEEQRHQTHHGDIVLRIRREQVQILHPGDEVNAGGHHRGRVDERRDGRGASHRVRQPCLQRHLRRLADRAAEQQQTDAGGHAGRQRVRRRQRLLNLQAAQFAEQQKQAQGERRVAHPGDDKRLARRQAVGRVAVVEADQQVTAKPHAFPTEKQHQQVVAKHQHQHGEHKQVHVGEEAAVTARFFLVLPHVARGVHMDEEADAGDHAHHHQGERVQIEGD